MGYCDVVVDARGRYLLAYRHTIECLDAAMDRQWITQDTGFDSATLTPTPDGGVVAWQSGRHSALAIDADGKSIGKLGGRQRPDATLPTMDLADAEDLIADDDGTFIANVGNRLQRFDRDGNGVHTWPQTGLRSILHNRMTPFYIYESESKRTLDEWDDDPATYWGRRPHVVRSHRVRGAVAGGALYLLSERGTDENAVGKFTRDGRCVWSRRVARMMRRRPAIDGAGNVYVVTDRNNRVRLHQIPANGGPDRVVSEDWRDGGLVMMPKFVTALPDGTIGLWDEEGEQTFLSPDGTLRSMSPRAQQELDQARAKRQARIDRDEEVD